MSCYNCAHRHKVGYWASSDIPCFRCCRFNRNDEYVPVGSENIYKNSETYKGEVPLKAELQNKKGE